jgi:hypothetical protein
VHVVLHFVFDAKWGANFCVNECSIIAKGVHMVLHFVSDAFGEEIFV